MKQILIILRGIPGSGKSTLAKKLRDYDKKIAWLKIDSFKRIFSDDSDAIIDDANKATINSLNYLLDQEFSVVMDGVFQNPKYIQEAVNLSKQKNIESVVYLLKCSLKTLQERDKTREEVKAGYRKQLGDETIEKLYKTLEENPYQNNTVLNTEDNSLNGCIEIIRKNLI